MSLPADTPLSMLRLRESLAARLAARRLSPLMSMSLAGLGALVAAAAIFDVSVMLGAGAPVPPHLDWRPPAFVAPPPPQKPASADVQTLSRPIFSKSRRPSAAAAKPASSEAEKANPSAPPPNVIVSAIVKFGPRTQAFVVSSTTPDGKWLAVGETVDGWSVDAIRSSEMVLKNGERTLTTPLYPEAPN